MANYFNNEDKISPTQKNSSIIVNQTYSYINNTGFYALANPTYYNYYYRFARRYAWWYDRYVPDFHSEENGYFSTGIAHSLVDGICNQIVGAKCLLKNSSKEIEKSAANSTLKKAYKWADGADLTTKLRTAVKYAGAIGTSLIKANIKAGEVWLEALRFDDFFFETDFTGKLVDVCCLIKSYTDTKPKNTSEIVNAKTDNGNDLSSNLKGKYYLIEKRYFKQEREEIQKPVDGGGIEKKIELHNVPYVVYQVHEYTGNITNAQSWNMDLRQNYDWNSIPQNVRKSIKRDFSIIEIGKEQRLPFFEHLGCELLQYNGADCSLSQQPFGQSILTDIISYLMGYDLAYSYFVRDMYQGKGIIFVAKELINLLNQSGTALNGLDESMFIALSKTNDSDNNLPVDKVQFDLRADEWRTIRNFIFENIATQLNISPSSIASYLADNSARTAKEVGTESSATDNYIDIQRGILEPAINRLLKVIGNYYGWVDDVAIRFAKTGSSNLDTIIDRVIKLKGAGLIHPYDALKATMPDADEYEVEEAYTKLMEYNKEQDILKANSLMNMDFDSKV